MLVYIELVICLSCSLAASFLFSKKKSVVYGRVKDFFFYQWGQYFPFISKRVIGLFLLRMVPIFFFFFCRSWWEYFLPSSSIRVCLRLAGIYFVAEPGCLLFSWVLLSLEFLCTFASGPFLCSILFSIYVSIQHICYGLSVSTFDFKILLFLLYPVIDLSLCSTSRFIGLNLISLFCSILLLLLLQLFNFQLYFRLLTILNWEFTQDLAWGEATIICILCIYAFDSSFKWFLPVTLTVPLLRRWAVSQSATCCISYCLGMPVIFFVCISVPFLIIPRALTITDSFKMLHFFLNLYFKDSEFAYFIMFLGWFVMIRCHR